MRTVNHAIGVVDIAAARLNAFCLHTRLELVFTQKLKANE